MRTDFIAKRRVYLMLIGLALIVAAVMIGMVPQSPDAALQGLTAPPVSAEAQAAAQKESGGHAEPMQVVNELRERVEKNPEDREALFSLANSYMMIRSFDKAEELYQRLLELEPKQLDARTNYALIKVQQKNYDAAIALLQANLAMAPGNAESVYNLGMIYAGYKNQGKQAIALWEEWLKAHPEESGVADEIKKQLQQLRPVVPPKTPG